MRKHSTLNLFIGGYTAFVVFWLLSRAWPLALLTTVAGYLFLPLPVLLLLSLWVPQRSLLLLGLPSSVWRVLLALFYNTGKSTTRIHPDGDNLHCLIHQSGLRGYRPQYSGSIAGYHWFSGIDTCECSGNRPATRWGLSFR